MDGGCCFCFFVFSALMLDCLRVNRPTFPGGQHHFIVISRHCRAIVTRRRGKRRRLFYTAANGAIWGETDKKARHRVGLCVCGEAARSIMLVETTAYETFWNVSSQTHGGGRQHSSYPSSNRKNLIPRFVPV